MKHVMLKIEGLQTSLDGEENSIELVTEGKLYEKGNSIYLVYEETEISGMEGCTTTVKLSEDKISMKRFGVLKSEIVFEKGKRTVTNYPTPYGVMDMEVLTKDMGYTITDANKGNVSIEYFVSLQGMAESTNKLNIMIM
ncbi:DUF1934 domain-containing protein [Marinisporobacter balticus]|uniref:Uncharacterized beta-barrel protein YwiB (DUF1934 family) n=1 Tax=Marinisporobacter balticus TaxID=2018667 RepID=A0A4R2KXJ2_9FIRM|nr:DUF1934 domain-containing protein [Marinisporobacter balticus]TCO78744.1 uncharacterized beta-barrel protein YwiB (DUF1934 family) [Marinisporobacter balticus]